MLFLKYLKRYYCLLIIMLFSCSLNNYGQDGWDEQRINYVNPNPTLKDVTNDGVLVDFSSSSYLQQIEIFSLMEEFMYDNHLGGIPIYETYDNKMTYLLFNQYNYEEYKNAYDEVLYDYNNNAEILKNNDFIKGVSLSIDRKFIANNVNTIPSINYYPSNIEFNDGISYNESDFHKNNLLKYYDNNQSIIDNYGYCIDKSKECFKKVCESLLENKIYKEKDTIKLTIIDSAIITHDYLFEVIDNVEANFNDTSVCNGKLTLDIEIVEDEILWLYGTETAKSVGCFQMYYATDCYIDKFTDAFASYNINHNRKSRLNFGIDTYSVNNTIKYNNQSYTYDALISSLLKASVINKDGTLKTLYDATLVSDLYNERKKQREVKIRYVTSNIKDICSVNLYKIELNCKSQYVNLEYHVKNDEIRLIISNELLKQYNGVVSYDLKFNVNINKEKQEEVIIKLYSEYN